MNDTLTKILVALMILTLMGLVIYSVFAQEHLLLTEGEETYCERLYGDTRLKNVPVRCLEYFLPE